MHSARLMFSLVLEAGIRYDKIVVLTKFCQPSTIFVQLVSCVWTDYAGRRLLFLLANSRVEVSHDENHVTAWYLVYRTLQVEVERIGGFSCCSLGILRVDWCVNGYQCDIDRMRTETT